MCCILVIGHNLRVLIRDVMGRISTLILALPHSLQITLKHLLHL